MTAFTEQALRDAWARWTEARPEWADWKLRAELRAPVPPVVPISGLHSQPTHRYAHELVVELLTRKPFPFHRPRPGPGAEEVWPDYEVLLSWRTDYVHLLTIVDALTEAMRDEQLMDAMRVPRVTTAERRLELFVWDRVLGVRDGAG